MHFQSSLRKRPHQQAMCNWITNRQWAASSNLDRSGRSLDIQPFPCTLSKYLRRRRDVWEYACLSIYATLLNLRFQTTDYSKPLSRTSVDKPMLSFDKSFEKFPKYFTYLPAAERLVHCNRPWHNFLLSVNLDPCTTRMYVARACGVWTVVNNTASLFLFASIYLYWSSA